ncbi:MAG TPA: 16S rRNA (adenine(1518)-N(6)/adenine(1519)-N(6))-dimethyltransferase RsmA, partial [Chryseosolibacter sp.]|nr:16S rRNA (adenine(1518)-N(6)/adenine(1519)-N(6))-dimethyltransferase RsmA [Chryseosolibacter sp.]
SLGQHFLHDQGVAQKIVDSFLLREGKNRVLEVGPGMGVLTQYLLRKEQIHLKVVEIDRDSVAYLRKNYPALADDIIEGDFLSIDLSQVFGESFGIIGNFPYNISSQIFFSVLQHRNNVDQIVCMLQKEVADRIAARHGNKTYGILSVLLQAFYDIDFLFKVSPGVFTPPPKVMSAVIRLRRNQRTHLACDEKMFFAVVKQGFNNRRKTLRNALKNLNLAGDVSSLPLLDKRAEQLSVDDFIGLTRIIEDSRGAATSS